MCIRDSTWGHAIIDARVLDEGTIWRRSDETTPGRWNDASSLASQLRVGRDGSVSSGELRRRLVYHFGITSPDEPACITLSALASDAYMLTRLVRLCDEERLLLRLSRGESVMGTGEGGWLAELMGRDLAAISTWYSLPLALHNLLDQAPAVLAARAARRSAS